MANNKLPEKEMQVLVAASQMSEEEIQGLYEEFIEECPSRKLDKNQFTKIYKKLIDDSNEDFLVEIVRSGDGQISYDELVAYLDLSFKLLEPEKAKELDPKLMALGLFKMFGVDKAEKINKTQFVDGCKNNETLKEIFASD
ncbi:unnamed protein product [Adineta steineri]|uniref:EF-hand domain-containing protein n=1 Tax=Adineta steineri TaxID=433720 RepID=A0A819DF60_9BILA|nr:unnamed protein product [Adineta steineri]